MDKKSVATINIYGAEYPLRSERRCKTCRHSKRYEIEESVVNGFGYNEAAMKHGNGTLSGQNVRSHFDRGHVPIVEAALDRMKAQMYSQTSDQINGTLEELADSLARQFGRAAFVVDRATQLLRAGEIKPTMHEGIQAAKLIAKAEEMTSKARLSSAATALRRVMSIARQTMDPDAVDRLEIAILNDPYLSNLIRKDVGDLFTPRA